MHHRHNTPWLLLAIAVAAVSCALPTGLDMKLMKQVTTDLSNNEAISPFLMANVMSEIWLATSGSTRDEITPVLGVTEPAENTFLPAFKSAIKGIASNSGNITVNYFNRMYVRSTFSVKPSFANYLTTFYNTSVVTFTNGGQAVRAINNAVAKATNDRITEVVTPSAFSADSAMVLVSALYFKGNWKHPFNSLKRGSFLTQTGEKQVTMMRLHGAQLEYAMMPQYEVVGLPYTDKNYCMLLIKPRERSMAAVRSLRSSLDSLDIDSIVDQLTVANVGVSMPRFRIEANYVLNEAITHLGIRRVFSLGADFGGLTQKTGELAISSIIHKVFIDVNERGTEAAGVVAGFVFRSRPIAFIANMPFFVVVYNKQHRINMFTGFVGSPSKA